MPLVCTKKKEMPLVNNANQFIFLHEFDGPSKEKCYYVRVCSF